MKTATSRTARGQRGHTLLFVMIVSATTFLILSGLLKWAASNTAYNLRNNQYFRTSAAAEAATEKVVTKLASDYQYDPGLWRANLDLYRSLVPESTESPLWQKYEFSDGNGNVGKTHVEYLPPEAFTNLTSQYSGLSGWATAFRIISNARDTKSPFSIPSAVRQDIQVATIPIFQFAIFYNLDLEIHPGPDMTVTGPVHGNRTVYVAPQNTLRFKSDVTAVGSLIRALKPGNPANPAQHRGPVIFDVPYREHVSSLNLPIGTNNTPAAVREIVEPAPFGEPPLSAMGKQRYYNQTDMIILVKQTNVVVSSGAHNSFMTQVPYGVWTNFLSTNVTFFNKRENKTIRAVQLDIGKLRTWNTNATNPIRAIMPVNDVRSIYIADLRSPISGYESGIRVINGRTILPKGLTIVTPNPLYVKGHYNCPVTAHLATTNTSQTLPASLVGDSITVLSENWQDGNSGLGLSSRTATPTTVNAAFLAGIVQTLPGSYSGGVENFPRFLEAWGSGTQFTYNGSMVVMYDSKYAIGQWQGTTGPGIYDPPKRAWSFDTNFRDINKLPPCTPVLRALIRGQWMAMKPNTTVVN
jgi:hypothetical protein